MQCFTCRALREHRLIMLFCFASIYRVSSLISIAHRRKQTTHNHQSLQHAQSATDTLHFHHSLSLSRTSSDISSLLTCSLILHRMAIEH
ncbi:hypothetical protein C8R42DRAFT_418844 [Lentinula raphanica]|nr:hypothetical protein C8R42DRAFT_418844 [Lentinula raphanica]